MANTIQVDVVSAEEQIYSGEAEFVILPGVMGELGIYPRHTPPKAAPSLPKFAASGCRCASRRCLSFPTTTSVEDLS